MRGHASQCNLVTYYYPDVFTVMLWWCLDYVFQCIKHYTVPHWSGRRWSWWMVGMQSAGHQRPARVLTKAFTVQQWLCRLSADGESTTTYKRGWMNLGSGKIGSINLHPLLWLESCFQTYPPPPDAPTMAVICCHKSFLFCFFLFL